MRIGVLSGCRLLNPAEDWAGNAGWPAKHQGLEESGGAQAYLSGRTRWFSLWVFFLGGVKWERKTSVQGRQQRESSWWRRDSSSPTSLPSWRWASQWIHICRTAIPDAELWCTTELGWAGLMSLAAREQGSLVLLASSSCQNSQGGVEAGLLRARLL